MKFIQIFFTVVITFSLFCCSANKNPMAKPVHSDEVLKESSPEIVIINFYLNSLDTVKINEVYINVGKLRVLNGNERELREGDLVISLTDESETNTVKSIVENPLLKKVEYSNNTASGEIKSETLELQEVNFFIRTQYEFWFQKIKVERLEGNELKLLNVFPFFKPRIQ
ncbi:hypothetical protein [Algoriphagus sp.]|uniref:hypothetical protein n=1 Tax=Algoriphagus sp. TaxID=1872435 RepID=UPI0025EA3D37|nr:hypothetical protein [Algoriphagus sp.]